MRTMCTAKTSWLRVHVQSGQIYNYFGTTDKLCER